MLNKVVHVVVGVLVKPNGEYLLASRPNGKGWAGWWEFPGGKIEVGESPEHALARELQEELGITPTRIQPWLKRRYDYPATHDAQAKTVLLHFYFVQDWQGELMPLEGQTLAWQSPQKLTVSPVLPANAPIMRALALPPIYAISNVAEMGETHFLRVLQQKLDQGLSLLQLREKALGASEMATLSEKILALCRPYGCKCLLNAELSLAQKLGFDGVHLGSQALMQCTEKPADFMVGASCHNADELLQAQKLQLDFAVLSPVLPTLSHPEASSLGWGNFSQLAGQVDLPIYALGGMQPDHLQTALACGARGVGMLRGYWQ